MGTEKIMIQSKPRGSDLAVLEQSHANIVTSNRSRTKQNHLLSTQPKKENSDAELNSSEGAAHADKEQFENESNYRREKPSAMKN